MLKRVVIKDSCLSCGDLKQRTSRHCRSCWRNQVQRGGGTHHNWKGSDIKTAGGGRARARRAYKSLGLCEKCKTKPATDRHHKDDNTSNNERSNIAFLYCHQSPAQHAGDYPSPHGTENAERVARTGGATVLPYLLRKCVNGQQHKRRVLRRTNKLTMIEITSNFRSKYASVLRKARTEKIRCVRLEVDLYYVARRESGHGQYLVRFFHKGNTVSAVCATIFNEGCKGCWQGRCCTHIAAAVLRGIAHGRKRKQESEAA